MPIQTAANLAALQKIGLTLTNPLSGDPISGDVLRQLSKSELDKFATVIHAPQSTDEVANLLGELTKSGCTIKKLPSGSLLKPSDFTGMINADVTVWISWSKSF